MAEKLEKLSKKAIDNYNKKSSNRKSLKGFKIL